MGLPIMNDFLIALNNHCFICLKHLPQIKSASQSVHSLQYLSRFLKLELEKLFRNAKGHNPESEGEISRLLVELCNGCASLNSNFVRISRQLEKIKMEFTSQLSTIQKEIMRAGEIDAEKSEMIRGGLTSDLDWNSNGRYHDELERSLALADMLRRKTVLKCSLELKRNPPRIMIRRLAGKKATPRKIKTAGYSTALELDPIRPSSKKASSFIVRLKSGRLKCQLCSKELANYSSFSAHYSGCHLKVRFQCRICFKTFSQRGSLKVHNENVHLGRRHICKLCSKSFSSSANLSTHLRLTECHRIPLKKGRSSKSVQVQAKESVQDEAFSPSSIPQVSDAAASPQVCESSYIIVPKSEVEVHEIKMESLNLEVVVPPPEADVDGDVFLNNLGDQSEDHIDPLGEPSTIGKNRTNRRPHGRRHGQISFKKGENSTALESQPPTKLTPPVKKKLTSSSSSMPGYKSCVQRNSMDVKVARKGKYECVVCGNTFYDKSTLVRHYRTVHERLKRIKCQLCNYRSFRQDHVTAHMEKQHPS